MKIEQGPSLEDQINKTEQELTPEDEKFVEQNPELGQLAMIDGGTSMIKEGREVNDPEMVEQGLKLIEAAKEDMATPREDDSERLSKLKRVLKAVKEDLDEYSQKGLRHEFPDDLRSVIGEIKAAEGGGQVLKEIWRGALKISKKHGLLSSINAIKKEFEQ